jgi:hypothetical protein
VVGDNFGDSRIIYLGPIVFLAFLGAYLLVTSGLARLADGDCRSLLTAWAEEGGMTILRCRRCRLIPQIEPSSHTRVIYRLTAVDGRGRLLTGWVSVTGTFWTWEFVPTGVEARWVRVREIPRPVAPSAHREHGSLWDRSLDG